jgi:asparagine synthase (glutamine-hydrolysing)
MAHGLEARSPLLDRELLEVAASAPAELKYANGTLKSLLKRAFRDELPAEVTARPKAGFVIPLAEWFRDPLLPLARDLLCNAETHVLRYFRPDALNSLVERHAAGRADHGRQLWALAMLELWHRRVVAGSG